MRQSVSDAGDSGNAGFQTVVNGFLLQPGLPFATVVTAEKINGIFRKHGELFGGNGIYSTPIVLWAFLGQVLRDNKEAACQSAVAGIISFCLQVGRDAPTADTGDYCRARAKLSEPALRELSTEIANDAEQQADEAWLWKRRHAKLIDGFTFTMPDTEKNQAEFPHPRTQKKGVGLPIARSVAILSLWMYVLDCTIFVVSIFVRAVGLASTIISSCGPDPIDQHGWTKRHTPHFLRRSNFANCATRSSRKESVQSRSQWSPH